MATLVELTRTNYNDEINTDKLLVIYLGSPSCGPCKIIKPKYKAYVKDATDEDLVKYCIINTSTNKRITVGLKVMSQPTIVFLKNGNEVSRLSGVQVDIDNMIGKINKYK